MLKAKFITTTTDKIRAAHATDIDSKLGTYLQVNPNLHTPIYSDTSFELERVHISRFRSGSHNLIIESGRFTAPRIPRELRICLWYRCSNTAAYSFRLSVALYHKTGVYFRINLPLCHNSLVGINW